MHMVCAYGTYNVPNLVLMGSSFKVIFYSLRTGKSAIFDGSRSILSLENRSDSQSTPRRSPPETATPSFLHVLYHPNNLYEICYVICVLLSRSNFRLVRDIVYYEYVFVVLFLSLTVW